MSEFVSGFAITGAPPLDNPELRETGLDLIPEQAGAVLGETFSQAMQDNVLSRLFQAGQDLASYGIIATPDGGVLLPESARPPMLSPEEANKRFSLPGMKPFTSPTPEPVAQSIFEANQERINRQYIIERRAEGLATSMAARFLTSAAASALDPVNLGASLIPVVGQARMAAWLAAQGSAMGRAGVRAGVGAAQGAVGAALIEPFIAMGMERDRNDWEMSGAALNIALGATIGGVLNPVVGRFSRAERDFARPRVSPEANEAAMAEAIVAHAQGRPVAAAQVLEAVETAQFETVARERISSVSRMEQDTARVSEIRTVAEDVRQALPPRDRGPAPVSLLEFIGSRGGVQEQGGDLRAIGADTHFVPGQGRIVRKSGMTLDYAREAAEEAGYLRPNSTIADFLDAVADEVAGRRVFLPHEVAIAHERWQARLAYRDQERYFDFQNEIKELADDYGIRLTEAEKHHATIMALDGEHPDAAIRLAAVGREVQYYGEDSPQTAERAAVEVANAPDPHLAASATESSRLRREAPDPKGRANEDLARLVRDTEALDMIIQTEREAGRLKPGSEKDLADASARAQLAESDARALDAAGMCMAVTR
jgi:hypothetical protein